MSAVARPHLPLNCFTTLFQMYELLKQLKHLHQQLFEMKMFCYISVVWTAIVVVNVAASSCQLSNCALYGCHFWIFVGNTE